MPRTKFDADLVAEMIANGCSYEAMAAEFGSTVESMKTKVREWRRYGDARFPAKLEHKPGARSYIIYKNLPRDVHEALLASASRRRIDIDALVQRLLALAVREHMIDAILDDGQGSARIR